MSATPSIISLIFILFLLLVVVGLIVGIVLWATGGRSRSGGEMACGRCGYAVRGLSELHCPECGVDLREAGIGRGGSSSKRGIGIALTTICGLILLSGCGFFAFAIFAFSGAPQAPTHQTLPAQPAPSMPNSSTQPTNPAGTDETAGTPNVSPAP